MRFASFTRPAVLMSLSIVLGGAGVWSCGSDGETAAGPPAGTGGFKQDSSVDASGGAAGSTAGSAGTAGAAGTGGTKDSGPDAPAGQTQCGVCTTDSQCAAGYKCVMSLLGDSFCAFDCASAACPSTDDECVDLSSWGQDGGMAGAAGASPDPDASIDSDASVDTDAGAAGSGGASGKFCVPKGQQGCPCTAAREGVKRDCFNTNSYGTCTGSETCKSGTYQGCDAPKAAKEICDGKDNNCNGFVDMDEPGITGNDLCAGGMAPPHSGFSCVLGTCELSGCEAGWTKYPASTPPSDGCNCPIDAPDTTVAKNDACAQATDQGAIVDVGSQPKVIQGTLSTDADADWYAIVATDKKEDAKPNSFWVHVEFQADGNPADEYRFELIRSIGGAEPCDATKAKSELVTYDWCAKSGATPETFANDDSSATYRLKVYRKPGAIGTCKPYKLKITNGGANPGPCPADDGCGT